MVVESERMLVPGVVSAPATELRPALEELEDLVTLRTPLARAGAFVGVGGGGIEGGGVGGGGLPLVRPLLLSMRESWRLPGELRMSAVGDMARSGVIDSEMGEATPLGSGELGPVPLDMARDCWLVERRRSCVEKASRSCRA